MKSLRTRLLIVLLLTVFVFWGAWICWQTLQLTREQTGAWDNSLQVVAQQVLLSVPANLDQLPVASGNALDARQAKQDPKADKFSFQVWGTREKNLLLRSANAPATPFVRDHANGFTIAMVNGERWRVYALTDASGRMQVQAAKSERQLREALFAANQQRLLAAGVMIVLLSCAVWFVIRWSLKPVVRVQALIHERQALDFTSLPAKDLPAEIRPLVESFNGLLGQLDAAVQAERRFIADAAHELRTPLAALLAHAQLALRADNLESSKAALANLVKGVERSARLSEQLLDSARIDAQMIPDRARIVAAHELVAVIAHDFEPEARERNQTLSLQTEHAELVADIDDLAILVRNLVDNACRYAGDGARIAVSCACEGASKVSITVADNGPGVAADERSRVFNRFYRVAGAGGRGSGIGLSLVARIAELYQGEIQAGAGLEGRGFSVSVSFPAHAG